MWRRLNLVAKAMLSLLWVIFITWASTNFVLYIFEYEKYKSLTALQRLNISSEILLVISIVVIATSVMELVVGKLFKKYNGC
jgi:hypothetical protein